MKQQERQQIELRLFESDAGYGLLDTIAQANVNLDEIPGEEIDSLVVQFSITVPPRRWQLPSRQSA
jgi:hypothetical protein